MSLPRNHDELRLSIEILSCRNLLHAQFFKSADPYVKVWLGQKDLHKTKHVDKNLNPVFGPDEQNQFTTKFQYSDLKLAGGLTLKAKDNFRLGTNDTIGILTVDPEKLIELAASGKETEFELQKPPNRIEEDAGFMTIRVKPTKDATGKYWKPIAEMGSPSSGESVTSDESNDSSGEFETPPNNKEILVEIKGCRNLVACDKGRKSDPYVKVFLGGRQVHKTNYIEKTLNPVFSRDEKNAYIIKCSAKYLYDKDGIELCVKDHDKGLAALGFTNDDLGSARVSAKALYKASTGKDLELRLRTSPKNKSSEFSGFINIHVREATLGDKHQGLANCGFFGIPNAITTFLSPEPDVTTGVSGLEFVDKDEKILLVEILSCRKLLAADSNGLSDPYIKVKMGDKELHKTNHVSKTLNPEFGEKEKNSFVIDCSISELFGANGIYIKVKDWDRLGGNDDLGSLQIPAQSLYECKEQEYHLNPPPDKNEDAGYVTVRTTEIDATERDDLKKRHHLPFGSVVPGLFNHKRTIAQTEQSDLGLLVEVVSCQDLRNGRGLDLHADPFVQVRMGEEMVHETGVVGNDQDPIYTVETKSVFILDVMKDEFLDNEIGLSFRVIDRDRIRNDELGRVSVSAEELLNCNGERMVLKLLAPGKRDHRHRKLIGGAVGAVGKAGGGALGFVGKGLNKAGGGAIGKGVGGALSGIGKVGSKVTRPVTGVAKAGAGAFVTGAKAGGKAVSKFNPLVNKRVDDDYGELTIRCRPATSYDRKFLKFAAGRKGDFLGCRQNTEFLFQTKGGAFRLPGSKLSLKEKSGPDAGVKKYIVRPEPDPQRMAATKYFSKDELDAESLKPSREWLNLSSGVNGRLFVELIGADNLPNMDKYHGKTDAFAVVVFEDSYAKTDIIDDCLSPRWMPWSRRAFCFNIDHASSDLRVGMFDYDKTSNHDMIGRIAISVSQLKPDTEYVVTYNLYEDAFTPKRKAKGTVTLRLRVELDRPKQLVMSNLSPHTDQFINFQTKQQLSLAKKVVEGKTNIVSYSIETLTMHVEELTSYKYVTYYIMDALISLLMWRGQVPFFGRKFWIPLHSMIAFYAAVTFVESPTLGFSYFWFANAWLLLSIQSWRNTTPLVWKRIMPFSRILMMMILDKAASPESIPANYRKEEATEFEDRMEERIRKAEEAALERYERNTKLMAETADLDQEGETDISTKKSQYFASPFKLVLYPIQQILYTICYYLRIVRNIYLWDDPYFAAFLTAGSLVIGIVFYILPWAFLLQWTGRIVAWTVFGPHMKLVDMFWYSKRKTATAEEEATNLQEYYKSLKEAIEKKARLARIRTEEAVKQKAVKELLFGYFIERVPILRTERFIDTPLHRSYAKPYEAPSDPHYENIQCLGGQNLVGTMIPELKSIKDQQEQEARKAAKQADEAAKREKKRKKQKAS